MSEEFDPHSLEPDEFVEEVYSFEFWFQAVDGYLTDRPFGHRAGLEEATLDDARRERLITTLCNYCVGETAALDGASGMVGFAPNRHAKIFLATQAADEARHVEVFIQRLRDLGVDDPESEIARRVHPSLLLFKRRLHDLVEARDWEAALFAQNVILETIESTVFRRHAASADPVTAEILNGVIMDERRHLGFGENDLGRLLAAEPQIRRRLADLRADLEPLVLGSLDGVMEDVAADSQARLELSREYLSAVERLDLT